MNNVLEIKHLTKYYSNVLGVKDLNLNIKKGEIFGFIGPNGAGKSTTIRSIMNLINKTEGEILFNGILLDKNNIALKKEIGYLPSEIYLYDDLTVKEILDFHQSFYDKNLNKRRKELVNRLKLDENKKIEDLSLGNLKKLGIILALVHEPKLLILDEPTSGLDPIMQQEFYKILKEEQKKGITIFYSTHILNEISKICDRVGIIKEGKLLEIEDIKTLCDKNLNYVTITSDEIDSIIRELNVEILFKNEDTIKFKNTILPDALIKKISKFKINNLLIEEATLEDIFMHYYN